MMSSALGIGRQDFGADTTTIPPVASPLRYSDALVNPEHPPDLDAHEARWGRCTPQALVAPGDARKVLRRIPLAARLAVAAIRDPTAFRTTMVAIRRYGALQKPLELFEYLRVVRRQRVVRFMEIGTLWGGTFFAHCASTAPDGHAIAIDAFPQESADAMSARYRAFAQPAQRVTCVWGDSHADETKHAVATALDGAALDLLFLDGDHSSEGAARDYEMYAPLVRSGGMIAFHDIDAAHEGGVPALWRSLRERHRSLDIVDRRHAPHGLGIGILFKE